MTHSTISRALGEAESEDLARWLADRLPGAGAVSIAPLAQTAGRSHAVYLVTRGDLRWVLRVAPDHREASVGGAFDLSREGRVLRALCGTGVPHPAAVVVRDQSAPTPRDFLVSEFVDGITLDRTLPEPFTNPLDGRAITESIVDTLARVNAVDWRATTLVDTARPDGYLERQFDKAASMLEKFRTRDVPVLDELLDGLRSDRPADYRVGLIHGDYSAMNIMVARERAEVKAVLDWETATVGDAMIDIGYLTARWVRPEEDPLMAAFALGGGDPAVHDLLPSRSAVAERYAEVSGQSMDRLSFYQGLAMARLAVVLEGRVAAARRRGRSEVAEMFTMMADGCAATVCAWRVPMAEPLLAGVRVVESASLLTGATVGMLLADLGADVVKVEPPHGDLIRWALGQVTPGYSPAHLQLNRNKQSVTLDMRTAEGAALFRRLIEGAAVLVDGNAPGTLAKLGLSDDALAQLNPGLVHCSVSGYGASGPYSAIPTHGLMMSALVGANPTTVTPDGDLLPAECEGAAISGRGGDAAIAAGGAAAMQICAALVRRERQGVGCRIDVSGADALLAQSMIPVVYQVNRDRIADTTTLPLLSDGTSGPRYRLYATADRRVVAFTALEPKFWARFCSAVGREDLVDARPDDASLERPLTEIFATRTQQQWIDLAIAVGLAIGPVRSTLEEISGDEHLRHRGVFVESEHPVAGAFTHVGLPGVIDDASFGIRLHAPGLGEHNDLFQDGWPA